VLSSGYLGVSLFFVLSGFVLAYSYPCEDGRFTGRARDFWRARFARVYPMYAVALLASAWPFAHDYFLDTTSRAVHAAGRLATGLAPALLQSWWPTAACAWNCPGWSLSAEAFFYLLFPAVAVWLARQAPRRILPMGLAVWALGLVAPLAYLALRPDGIASPTHVHGAFWLRALRYAPPAHLPQFVLGVATGLAFARRRRGVGDERRMARVAALATAALVAIMAVSDRLPHVLLHDGLVAPLFALLVWALAHGAGAVARLLATAPMRRLGEGSYALYLLHVPVMQWVSRAEGAWRRPLPAWWWIAVVGLASVALADVAYRYVEEPVRQRLRGVRREAPRPVEERARLAA
jgi:peptidoglycan/LPS O-acetylase OafA/YrhL